MTEAAFPLPVEKEIVLFHVHVRELNSRSGSAVGIPIVVHPLDLSQHDDLAAQRVGRSAVSTAAESSFHKWGHEALTEQPVREQANYTMRGRDAKPLLPISQPWFEVVITLPVLEALFPQLPHLHRYGSID